MPTFQRLNTQQDTCQADAHTERCKHHKSPETIQLSGTSHASVEQAAYAWNCVIDDVSLDGLQQLGVPNKRTSAVAFQRNNLPPQDTNKLMIGTRHHAGGLIDIYTLAHMVQLGKAIDQEESRSALYQQDTAPTPVTVTVADTCVKRPSLAA